MNADLLPPTIDPAAVHHLSFRADAVAALAADRLRLGGGGCWATQGVAYGLILDGIQTDGLTVVTLRAMTAALLLWVWLALTDRSP